VARYLIRVTHEPEVRACAQAVQVFLATGSHLVTRADWGRKDEARYQVPPAYQASATIAKLSAFTIDEIESLMNCHTK
jgi:hypothetical protein